MSAACPVCPKHGPHPPGVCPKCDALEEARTVVATINIPKLTVVPGLTKVGEEFFNLPALERQLRYELEQTCGGSEKTFIRMLIRLVQAIAAEKQQ